MMENNAPEMETARSAETAAAVESAVSETRILDNPEEIADALEAQEKQPTEPAADEVTPEKESGPEELQDENEEKAEDSKEMAAALAPSSWGKEAQEIFNQLPPELQQEVKRRETEREIFVNAKAQEAAQNRKEAEALYQYGVTELQTALETAQAAVMAEFGAIDFNALKRQDPAAYLKIEAMMEQRQAAIAGILEQKRQLEEAGQLKYAYEMNSRLNQEAISAKSMIKDIIGAEESPAGWRDKAERYLSEQGAPPEHISGLSHAYQAVLIAKAMKYDELRKTAQAAQAKVAAAPKIMAPKGSGPAEGKNEGKRQAMEHLSNNPGDQDALAAALNYL